MKKKSAVGGQRSAPKKTGQEVQTETEGQILRRFYSERQEKVRQEEAVEEDAKKAEAEAAKKKKSKNA